MAGRIRRRPWALFLLVLGALGFIGALPAPAHASEGLPSSDVAAASLRGMASYPWFIKPHVRPDIRGDENGCQTAA